MLHGEDRAKAPDSAAPNTHYFHSVRYVVLPTLHHALVVPRGCFA
jgi:hypothetical protein